MHGKSFFQREHISYFWQSASPQDDRRVHRPECSPKNEPLTAFLSMNKISGFLFDHHEIWPIILLVEKLSIPMKLERITVIFNARVIIYSRNDNHDDEIS